MVALENFITGFIEGPLEYKFAWLLMLCLPFALIKGRWIERFVSIGIIAGLIASELVRSTQPEAYLKITALVVVDVCLLAFTVPFALWSNRYWPMWMLGCWAMLVLIDFAILMQPRPSMWVYVNASAIWTDAAMIILGVGTYMEGMRRPKTQLPKLELVLGSQP